MSKHRVPAHVRGAVEKHHTIGFDSIEAIDWHLRHLWCVGFKTIVELPTEEHHKHTTKKNSIMMRKRYEEASRQLPKPEYALLFPKKSRKALPVAL